MCPPPFYDPSLFPDDGGCKRIDPGMPISFLTTAVIDGRLCKQVDIIQCCLPCPMTDWVYPERFETLTSVANWVSLSSQICCVFLLLSWAFLPVEKTNRHYLSICLTFAILLMNVSTDTVSRFSIQVINAMRCRWALSSLSQHSQSNATTKSHRTACRAARSVVLLVPSFF